MRRKPVHLIAAIAESFRFFAIAFLAYSIGALGSASVSGILRYSAAPQILFAVGFFFLWLDPARYIAYRPLLLLGKAACLICFLPMGTAVAADPTSRGLSLGVPALGFGLAFLIAIIDILSLSVLILVRDERATAGPAAPCEAKAPKPAGQSPDEIERVEV
jgi:hypothetical protein